MADPVAALLHWRQHRDRHTREIVREHVSADTRHTVDLLTKAVVAQGEEILRLKEALLALADASAHDSGDAHRDQG